MQELLRQFFLFPIFYRENVFRVAIFLLYSLINGLVLFNALGHNPEMGYDARGHLFYIQVLGDTGRLPDDEDTWEFFNPPLSYTLPGIFHRTFYASCSGTYTADFMACVYPAAKFAQFLNGLYSLILTFYLLKIGDWIHPGSIVFKGSTLVLVSMLPVYYKSFAFVRPEPLLALLTVMMIYHSLRMIENPASGRFQAVIIGILMGLAILTRQWGFFLILAIVAWAGLLIIIIKKQHPATFFIRKILLSLVIALIIGSPFYAWTYHRYHTLTPFNRPAAPSFSLNNQPAEFYFGLCQDKIFKTPHVPTCPNQFIPIFYSEIWGDYWGQWIIQTADIEENPTLEAYMGRVNVVSLLPALILLCGIGIGIFYTIRFMMNQNPDRTTLAFSLFSIVIVISIAGYFGFLIQYPNYKHGDTIKATYMLQIFPVLALMGGECLFQLQKRLPGLYLLILILLVLIFLHNIPAMLTHYVSSGGGL